MSRKLESWAQSSQPGKRPRVTWFSDMLAFAGTGFGLRHKRPDGAPPRPATQRYRLSLSDLSSTPDLRNVLAWRLDYQVAGLDALSGLQGPVIFAANETGVLDWQVLRSVLPARLRTTQTNPSRSLSAGRSVVVFTDEPLVDGGVGEFTPVLAQLASQHNVPIVPVALVGTFKLKEVLRLSLRHKPRVSVRFGAPVYVRGRGLAEARAEVQGAVEQLFHTGELSWWNLQRAGVGTQPTPEPMPRWRRLWHQTKPRAVATRRQIWRRR